MGQSRHHMVLALSAESRGNRLNTTMQIKKQGMTVKSIIRELTEIKQIMLDQDRQE